MHKHVGYNEGLYESNSLRFWAKKYLKHLPEEVDGLLSMGKSGCAIASAMLTQSKRDLVHVIARKNHESCHSGTLGGAADKAYGRTYAIVDDFIARGFTMRATLKWAKRHGFTVAIILVGSGIGDKQEFSRVPVKQIEKLT